MEIYKNTIGSLVNIFIDLVGEDKDISGIIDCKFIGSNIKVVLKILNESLGKNIYTVGIYLLVVGLAKCFSIEFTILLNFILDSFKKRKFGFGETNIDNDDRFASEGVRFRAIY